MEQLKKYFLEVTDEELLELSKSELLESAKIMYKNQIKIPPRVEEISKLYDEEINKRIDEKTELLVKTGKELDALLNHVKANNSNVVKFKMNEVEKFLYELPEKEVLDMQTSDVLFYVNHIWVYQGKKPPTSKETVKTFYEVLRDRLKITHGLIYNPRDKTYLCSVGKDSLQWTEYENHALLFRIDEVEVYREFTRKAKILTRVIYKIHEEVNQNIF